MSSVYLLPMSPTAHRASPSSALMHQRPGESCGNQGPRDTEPERHSELPNGYGHMPDEPSEMGERNERKKQDDNSRG